MKKFLLILLVSYTFAKSIDLIVINDTGMNHEHNCDFEYMPKLSNFVGLPAVYAPNIAAGSSGSVHIDFADLSDKPQHASIVYMANCRHFNDFSTPIKISITPDKYQAYIRPDNRLSFANGSAKQVTMPITADNARGELVVQHRVIEPIVPK